MAVMTVMSRDEGPSQVGASTLARLWIGGEKGSGGPFFFLRKMDAMLSEHSHPRWDALPND